MGIMPDLAALHEQFDAGHEFGFAQVVRGSLQFPEQQRASAVQHPLQMFSRARLLLLNGLLPQLC